MPNACANRVRIKNKSGPKIQMFLRHVVLPIQAEKKQLYFLLRENGLVEVGLLSR